MNDSTLLARATAWAEQDPDPVTRSEVERLLESARAGDDSALADLRDRFDSRLAFGTAGLRGALGAGPARMNRVLVAQAAAGLAAYLREQAGRREPTGSREPAGSRESGSADATTGAELRVVVGYDGRHNSRIFANDTAELMAGAGLTAVLLPEALPTPVLAFAVRHLDAAAGVMVTASHNPASDNGYKVYLGGEHQGSQIVPPADAEIAAHIERVAAGDIRDLPRSTDIVMADAGLLDAYVAATAGIAAAAGEADAAAATHDADAAHSRRSALRGPVVYTPMHGVGFSTAARVFAEAGFPPPVVVDEQRHPDPDFPTVAFPNPEEPGAMDLAFDCARSHGAALVLANDPDADRLAVGIPDPASPGGWRRLSGNEVGALLGWRAAERVAAGGHAQTAVLACSIVSSPVLAAIARAHGLAHVETLTGFKWISRVPGLAFGFEEALGYLVDPDVVRDKDGISAAVAILDLAHSLAARGQDLAGRLTELAERFGAFASAQISIRVDDLARIDAMMSALRADPPRELAGSAVQRIDDLRDGFEQLPPSDVLRLWFDDGARVMVRPSGTEPKLKIYVDASSTEGDAASRTREAEARVERLGSAMRRLLEDS